MWLQKEIKNETALKFIRMFVALLYVSIGVQFLTNPPASDAYAVHGFKVISVFCLMLAFFSIFPLSNLVVSKIKNSSTITIYCSVGTILLLHTYLLIAFGAKFTASYIFLSLVMNTLIQAPIAYLSEKVYLNEKK